jgi:hypothetical protein
MDRHTLARARGQLPEFSHRKSVAHRAGQIVGDAPGQLRFRPVTQEQDWRFDPAIAQRHRFFQRGQAKETGAAFERDLGNRKSAVAICFILEH